MALNILLGIGVVVSMIGGWFFLRLRRRHHAASNVLLAKYSWLRLDKDTQQQVHERAVEFAISNGKGRQGFANEVEQFGWYALAMADMGLQSTVPGNPVWHRVRNPYLALDPQDPVIVAMAGVLKTEFSAIVTVNAYDKYKV